MPHYVLRPATLGDREAMMILAHEGLRPHAEAVRPWNEEAEIEGFRVHFTPETIQVITVAGEDAGYIKLEQLAEYAFIDGIYLARAFRGRGLGTLVLKDLLDSAKVPIRLRVYVSNPARALYGRLGFREVLRSDTAVTMEYSAGGHSG
ncbi:MAG: GNAT family N-acetyltransferase [Pseudomonadota bacterium]